MKKELCATYKIQESTFHIEYYLVETFIEAEETTASTYGIQILKFNEDKSKILETQTVEDISLKRDEIDKLIQKISRGLLMPGFLMREVEDFLLDQTYGCYKSV